MSWQKFVGVFFVFGSLMCSPAAAWSQSVTTGAIAGEVRDTTGAVLPGVTVEAASPALIEKVRTVVTDDQGQYKIVDLRPGIYSVTFSLTGFSTVRRDGLELTTGFTAAVNAEMRVGSVLETVTVTGASPVVDVQNVRSQNVLSRDVLDSVPTAKNFAGLAALTLGAIGTRDVAGNAGDWVGAMRIHGNRNDGVFSFDGMNSMSLLGAGNRRIQTNQAAAQEMVLQTGGMGAELETGGVAVNVVPKEGGNTFSGVFSADYTGKGLQSGNLTDELRARGLTRSNSIKEIHDVYGGLGGPIKQDRLWFYTAHRWLESQEELAGAYFNKMQGTLFYEPDLSRPAHTDNPVKDFLNLRVTWQVSQKHKITVIGIYQENCLCFLQVGPLRDPAASWNGIFHERNIQPAWSYPATSRLLFEAGFVARDDTHVNVFADGAGVTQDHRAVQDLSNGTWYGSHVSGSNPSLFNLNGWLNDYGTQVGHLYSSRFAMSYVTGSHAFKTGLTNTSGFQDWGPGKPNLDEAYQFRNRVPVGLWQLAGPGYGRTRVKLNLGIYAQDQWTLRNVTLNMGVRFDYINGYNPAQVRPGGTYTPEFRFDPVYNLPNWKDISPRVGAAYDLFGNGKTAFKMSLGKYMHPVGTRIAQHTNPSEAISGVAFRTWNDVNGDYVPDCDLKSTLASGECGALANQRFGTPVVTRRYDSDFLTGWGQRDYNWQTSASLQHELRPAVALSVGYFRTWYGNFTVTDNLAVMPADYDPYCITVPVDTRLPGGGGNQICGLYDIRPTRFGQVNDLVTKASHFGKRTEVFNGVDVGINARFGNGGLLSGGVSIGQTVINNCLVVDSPDLRFCETTDPQKQVKLAVAYPLPKGFQASATFQNLPGINRLASYVATNAQIAPSLGRNLGACGASVVCNATVAVDLIEPNTLREPRQSQLDVRLSKLIRMGPVRLQGKFDIYNLFNANDIQLMITRYGSAWLNASSILAGRTFKFGAQLDF
jgi:hypothetical protein